AEAGAPGLLDVPADLGLHPPAPGSLSPLLRPRLYQHWLRPLHPSGGTGGGPPQRPLVVGGRPSEGVRTPPGVWTPAVVRFRPPLEPTPGSPAPGALKSGPSVSGRPGAAPDDAGAGEWGIRQGGGWIPTHGLSRPFGKPQHL